MINSCLTIVGDVDNDLYLRQEPLKMETDLLFTTPYFFLINLQTEFHSILLISVDIPNIRPDIRSDIRIEFLL